MIKKAVAMLSLALTMAATTGAASASEAETNATDKVECLFRVYIQEGGEQGLECLI